MGFRSIQSCTLLVLRSQFRRLRTLPVALPSSNLVWSRLYFFLIYSFSRANIAVIAFSLRSDSKRSTMSCISLSCFSRSSRILSCNRFSSANRCISSSNLAARALVVVDATDSHGSELWHAVHMKFLLSFSILSLTPAHMKWYHRSQTSH